MSDTFNPGTNEPTGELGSEPKDWDEKHGIPNEGQGEYDPAEVQRQADEPAYANTDAQEAENVEPTENTGTQTTYDGETVTDAQDYIDQATDDADRVRRADEVERVENERDGDNRKGVTDAIDKARQPRT